MAMTRPPRRPGRVWTRLHFLLRFLGLAALLAVCVGLVLAQRANLLASWEAAGDAGRAALEGRAADFVPYLVVAGLGVIALALLVEALAVARSVAARRSAFAFNALLQVGLAALLLVGVNLLSAGYDLPVPDFLRGTLGERLRSPGYHATLDWTRDGQFTLPEPTRAALAKLRDQTTVLVYVQHKTFGGLSAQPDDYDFAAEAKVVEKVRDLVAQLRRLGGRFEVHVVDAKDKGSRERLDELTRDAPELKTAVDRAQENSIFFHSFRPAPGGGRREALQELSFNEFYRLDKTASQEADGGRGNLVLLPQGRGPAGRGVGPFASKILNIEERRPRVGVAVIHEYLTTRGPETFGLAGLRKALERHGFEVRDVVLARWGADGPRGPAVSTFEESKLDRLYQRERLYERLLAEVPRRVQEVNRTIASVEAAERRALDAQKKDPGNSDLADDLAEIREALTILRARREGLEARRAAVAKQLDASRVEREGLDEDALRELQRMSDLPAKLRQTLADCDLLLVVRPTLADAPRGRGYFKNLPPWLHHLDAELYAELEQFVKSGKPLLACVGPAAEVGDGEPPPGFPKSDGLEAFLAGLGVRLGKQTVLYDAETAAFAEQAGDRLTGDAPVQVPPLLSDWRAGAGLPAARAAKYGAFADKPNPLKEALRLEARGLGRGQAFDLRLRHPRPVYYEPPAPGDKGRSLPPYDPVFLMTAPEAWNEDQPFAADDALPAYKGSGPDDPHRATADERRRGPFPVGVALAVAPPAAWYGPGERRPEQVRVAVVGQGWFLVGPDLDPARERLLLDTCNWLLRRDDALPHAGQSWSYPRVEVAEKDLWLWAARLGLPVLFALVGTVVLLSRRLR